VRIFSKYHDYYDKALGYGIDPNVIYERKEEEITESLEKQPELRDKLLKINDEIFDFRVKKIDSDDLKVVSKHIILFCGKIYFCIEVMYTIKTYDDYYKRIVGKAITEFIYTFDAFEKVITKHSKINLENNLRSGIFSGAKVKVMTIRKRFKSLFDKQGSISEDVAALHFELDSPVIVIAYNPIYTYAEKGRVFKNKCLKDIDFYKIVNPFNAFQELSMFIGGVMGGKSPIMIEVTDKDRIAKHGFDKFSFRKEKKE